MAQRWKHAYTTAAGEPSPGFLLFFFPCSSHSNDFMLESAVIPVHHSCLTFCAVGSRNSGIPTLPLSSPLLSFSLQLCVSPTHPLSAEAHRPTFMSGFFSLSYRRGARCVFRLILAATRSTVALQFPAWQKKKKPEGKVMQPLCWEEREAQSQNVLEWLFAV